MVMTLRQNSLRHSPEKRNATGDESQLHSSSTLHGYVVKVSTLSHSNPDDAAFCDVPIAPPSPNNPNGSRVSDDKWEWPAAWVNSSMKSQRMINFSIGVDDKGGRLTDSGHAPLFLSVKRYLCAQIARPIRGYSDIGTIRKRDRKSNRLNSRH